MQVEILDIFEDISSDLEKAASGAAALADILSEITLFWGHFESNILYFWESMEEEELAMDNGGWFLDI